MPDFHADTSKIQAFADELTEAEHRGYQASGYARTWITDLAPNAGGLVFSKAVGPVQAIGMSAERVLQILATYAESSASQVSSAAQLYQQTDQDNSAVADRMIPTAQYGYETGGGI